MDPADVAPPLLAPWDPEPSVQWTETMEAGFRQRRLIRTCLRDLGMLENDLQYWTERLENVSAIVHRGCDLSGVPNAGELLLDMIIELLHAIPRSEVPPPEPGGESPAHLSDQDRGPLPSSPSHGEVSAAGILGRDLAGTTSRSSSDEVVLCLQPQGKQEIAQPEIE